MSIKKLLWLRSKTLPPVFSSRIFMASYLTFRSFIHFLIYFCVWCQKVVQFHSCACCCPVFSAPFAKETFFFLWILFLTSLGLVGHTLVDPILGSLLYSHFHCGPFVCFLKPHHIGDGEENGDTLLSPPCTSVQNHSVQAVLTEPPRCEWTSLSCSTCSRVS